MVLFLVEKLFSSIQACNLKLSFKGEDFCACVVNNNEAINLGSFGGMQRTSKSAYLILHSTWFALQFWGHLASFPRPPIAEERDYTVAWLGC